NTISCKYGPLSAVRAEGYTQFLGSIRPANRVERTRTNMRVGHAMKPMSEAHFAIRHFSSRAPLLRVRQTLDERRDRWAWSHPACRNSPWRGRMLLSRQSEMRERAMAVSSWSRRDLFKAASVGVVLAAFSIHEARDAAAQQIKWSTRTEPPKLKAPANACDCHHHIYGSQYKSAPRSTL